VSDLGGGDMNLSVRTRWNWLLDAKVFTTALIATLSGIYFLYFPVGGYQGGRNPSYGIQILFERLTWDLVHTWSGILMIIAGVIHLVYHWSWVKMMGKRILGRLAGQPMKMSGGARINLVINAMIALGFVASALSGVYFLFQPAGLNGSIPSSAVFIFSRYTWDLIHTWSSIVMILAALAHIIIHWGWIAKVTKGFFNIRRSSRIKSLP
jgi:hypothetical protein